MSTLEEKRMARPQARSGSVLSGTLNRDRELEIPEEPSKVEGFDKWNSPAPDGGVTAWLTVLGAWCVTFCSFGWINSKYSPPGRENNASILVIVWLSFMLSKS